MRPANGAHNHPVCFLVSLTTALVLFVNGCATIAPPPSAQPPLRQWPAAQLIEALNQRHSQLRSLRALARVNYVGPDGKGSVQEAVLVERPDRLRLETLTMLGAVLIVTANASEIIGYHSREGIMVRGRPSQANLVRYTQIPLELQEVTALLMGMAPVKLDGEWRQEGDGLVFFTGGKKTDAITFAAAEPVPTRWERFNSAGGVEIRATFAEHISTPSGWFPMRIWLEAPAQNRTLEVRYQDPDINTPIPVESFSQQRPAHVREIPIEAIGG